MMRGIKIRTREPAMNFKLFSVQNLQPHFEVVFLRRIRMICGAHILSNFREERQNQWLQVETLVSRTEATAYEKSVNKNNTAR